MSGGFFRGTSADQDTRFSNKQAKLLKSQKFAPELEHLVDIMKVKMDVIKPWIARRVTELIGFEDEVLINFIYSLLEEKEINGKAVQIQLTGFMEKNTGKFMKELWALLLSAQTNASGVPQQFLDAKEEETRKKKVETDRIFNEIQQRKEKETKESEHEKAKNMDGGLDKIFAEGSNRKPERSSDIHSEDEKEAGVTNGLRGRKRSSKSPYSSDRSPSPHRGIRARSIGKSHSKSRSSSKGRSISRSNSRSPRARRQSVSLERIRRSPQRRSITPRRHSAQGSLSPRRRSHPGRRSSSRSRHRSPSPLRHRVRSPLRRRSPSPLRRRSPSPALHRSPSPIRRLGSPLTRHSPSPWRRRSPSTRRPRSPSPRRRRSPSPRRRRSPSPRRRRSPSPWRRRSPSPRRHRSPPVRRRRQRSTSSSITRSPVQRASPVRRRFRSPMRRRSPIPVRRRSPPPHRRSLSPWDLRSRSPVRRKSVSPVKRRSPVPARRRSPTTSLGRSQSPVSGSSASPVRRGSVSPVMMKSPRLQKSLRRSSKERTRNQESSESARMERRQLIALSPQRDHSDRNRSSRKVPSVSPSEKSLSYSDSRRIQTRSYGEDRLAIPFESPGKRAGDRRILDGNQSSTKLKDHRARHDSPVRNDERLQNSRDVKENSYKSTEKGSVRSSGGKNRESPDRPFSHRRSEGSDLRQKDNDMRSVEVSVKEVQVPKKSPHKGLLAEEKPDASYPGDGSKSDEKRSSHLKNAKDNSRSDSLANTHKKVERSSPNLDSDSGSDESDKQRAGIAEKRKHRRSGRREAALDDTSPDSEVEDRKEAKRRRKEEKKTRKEERRRRREERRRQKEEKRASKRKRKSKDADFSSSDVEKNEKNANASNGSKKYSSEEVETESQKKRLEIELRQKALESLRAKKGISQ